MEKAKHLFIKIDQFIFAKLDQLKSDTNFQKLNDVLLNLNEEQQKIFIQVIVFASILIPYIIISIFWWSNSQIKSRLDFKNQIIDQISVLNGNKDSLQSISDKYLAAYTFNSREEVENKIVNIASRYNINTNKIMVVDFNTISTTSTVSKIETKLKFSDFGTMDFSNFIREIVDVEKFKILKLDLNKNNENNLLQGTIEVRHIGRAIQIQ
jgi:hypothetical protein